MYKYKPYYKFNPTIKNFMDDQLSPEDVAKNIVLLVENLTHYFSQVGGTVNITSNCVITITTHLTQNECDDIVKNHLNDLKLYAEKMT